MSSYRTFTTTRTTEPDPVALLAAMRNIDPTAGYSSIGSVYHVKTATEMSGGNITAIQNAIDTAPTLTPQRRAQNEIDNMPIFQKALLLTLLDQINVLRTRAGLATVTPAQALAAVRDKAGTL